MGLSPFFSFTWPGMRIPVLEPSACQERQQSQRVEQRAGLWTVPCKKFEIDGSRDGQGFWVFWLLPCWEVVNRPTSDLYGKRTQSIRTQRSSYDPICQGAAMTQFVHVLFGNHLSCPLLTRPGTTDHGDGSRRISSVRDSCTQRSRVQCVLQGIVELAFADLLTNLNPF